MNVLLVDDTSLYRTILGKSLDEIGVALHIAENGADALRVAAALPFDLVAISMQLGDMDGIALTKKLREQPAFVHTPIIILTGSASREVSEKAERTGVTEIFRKQDIGELVHFMHRFLVRYRALQGRVLYVEDNLSQRLAMSAQLREWGLQVDDHSSADTASLPRRRLRPRDNRYRPRWAHVGLAVCQSHPASGRGHGGCSDSGGHRFRY